MQKYRKLMGYEWPEEAAEVYMARSNDGDRDGPWPQVKWLKVEVLTATVKSSAPQEVEHAYQEWLKWEDFIQEVRALVFLLFVLFTFCPRSSPVLSPQY